MLDHVSISVKDYDHSLKFYDETLSILGYGRIMTFDTPEHCVAGYGMEGRPSFWIGVDRVTPREDEFVGKARGLHIAFKASDVKAVQAWHQKCLELGGQDNGAPGVRPEYHPGYYGAFIVDPDGWRIEACFHGYQGEG